MQQRFCFLCDRVTPVDTNHRMHRRYDVMWVGGRPARGRRRMSAGYEFTKSQPLRLFQLPDDALIFPDPAISMYDADPFL